jgi:hypothetical protein
MSFSMYQAAIPAVVKILTNFLGILDKAEAHCTAKKIDPAVILNSRLYPDMFPFVRQVQIATDQAKGMAARLTGSDVPSYADVEASFEELKARIQKTIDFVQSFAPAKFDGAETRDITLKFGPTEYKFVGGDYLTGFVLPNFYFHTTTAYAILRHCGIEVGKRDFV